MIIIYVFAVERIFYLSSWTMASENQHQKETFILPVSVQALQSFTALQSLQLYNLYSFKIFTVLQSLQLYNLYSFTILTVLQSLQLYNLYSFTIFTTLQSLQFYNLYSFTTFTMTSSSIQEISIAPMI